MRADEFISVYNRIDRHLRRIYKPIDERRRPGYEQVVLALAKVDPVVESLRDDLLQFGYLRNAIEHSRYQTGFIIAEPTEWALERIREVERTLLNPQLVVPRFAKPVEVIESCQRLTDAMSVMKQRNYSQLPVFNGEVFCGLLTERTIARWLLSCARDRTLANIADTTVEQVLQYDEVGKANVLFRPANTTVFEAISLFKRGPGCRHPFLEAILITAKGEESRDLQGIVTIWDIVEVQAAGHPGVILPY